jgi:hypothetical protein
MRATLLCGAGDVRVENVPDPVLKEPTDALVRVTTACICGSDLWPYPHPTVRDASVTSSSASLRTSALRCRRSRGVTWSSRRSPTLTALVSSAARAWPSTRRLGIPDRAA